jgi:hypothetical protein
MSRTGLALILLATATLPAFANIANPDRDKLKITKSPEKTQMIIRPDDKAKEAKLIIPRKLLRQLNAELDGNASPDAATHSRFPNLNGTQTVISGLFLSLAFVFGGVWLARSRKTADKLTRAALGVAVLAVCGLTASIAYANAGPPAVARSLTSKILIQDAQWYGVYGQVKVETTGEADQIILVLPKAKEEKSN